MIGELKTATASSHKKTERTVEEITADIESSIEDDQQRMQCMVHPHDGMRCCSTRSIQR